MSEAVKLALLAALRRILEPLARLAIEAGIGVGEFHELTKTAFVKAAHDRTRRNGKPNLSAIALVTGLRRVEAKKLLRADQSAPPAPERNRHRAERVLAGWWNDYEYLDDNGRPRPLPLTGPAPSFDTLARKYSGEPQAHALKTELLRARAITELPDGTVQALSRSFATARWEPTTIAVLGERVRDQLMTLVHNMRHPSRPRFVRTVMSDRIDPRYLPILERDLTSAADGFADSVEDGLHSPRTNLPEDATAPPRRLGVTVYVFEDEPVTAPAISPPSDAPSDLKPARPQSTPSRPARRPRRR